MVQTHRQVKGFLFLWTALCISGQLLPLAAAGTDQLPQTLPPTLSRGIPKEVRFNGVLQDGAGAALTGVQGVTFGLYAEQQGGAPLWLETQTVEADAAGRYTVLLGAMRADGLPAAAYALAGSADSAAKSGWTTAAASADSLPTAAGTTQDQISQFTYHS